MKKILLGLAAITFILSSPLNAHAQSVTISGEGITTSTIAKDVFANMKQVVVMAKGHDEKVHRYSGVTLADILTKAGVSLGEDAKRKTVSSYIVITAADNYKAIYALSEIDPLFASRSIILVDKEDKKILPASNGPFQVIVPGEKKYGRWIRQVTAIQVFQVK